MPGNRNGSLSFDLLSSEGRMPTFEDWLSRQQSAPIRRATTSPISAYTTREIDSSVPVGEDSLVEQDDTYSGDEMLVGNAFGHSPDFSTLSGHPMVVGTNRVGVEIELENIQENLGRTSRYWRQISDGSLRNHGAEFIFRSPFGGVDLFNAMIEIDGHLHKLNPDGSQRCSTHVHIDVRDMTVTQLKNMILAYAVYERVLFHCSGWHRYRNNFCVALGFAQSMVTILSNSWNKGDSDFLRSITSRWDKYSAINFLPMTDKGSVEFRISEAKWRKGQLLRLCNRFLSLKEIAMGWEGNHEDLISYLLSQPLSKVFRKSLPRSLPDHQGDIECGAKLAYDILHMSALPKPTRTPAPVGDARYSIERLDGEHDSLFVTRSHVAAWEEIKSQFNRLSQEYQDRFGGMIPDSLPELMTFSYLHQLRRHMSIDSGWLLPNNDEGTTRRQFREYCEWHDITY